MTLPRMFLAGAAAAILTASPTQAQSVRAISQSERAQGAQAHPQLLSQFGGTYSGPQTALVDRVGKRVAVRSGISNAQSDFTISLLDSPVENAFAIPGGYVYVTRQLLALMNSEAELAAVLGHEVGHVAARHSNRRNTRSTIGGILSAGIGLVTGSDLLSRVANTGAQLYTLGYSRNQEYEADGLGVRYSTAAGYNPFGMADMLAQLNAGSALAARASGRDATTIPTWASTHPNGADRVARARTLAQQQRGATDSQAQDVVFLRALDGLRYDDNPAQGIIEGQTFRHPALRVRFDAPAGYTMANGTDAVTISGTGGQAQFKGAAATTDLTGFLAARFGELGARTAPQVRTSRINGLDVALGTVRASANGRAVDASIVAYRFPSATYYLTIVTAAGAGPQPFNTTIQSVAPLSQADAGQIRGKVIRIHTVAAGDTIDSLSRRMAYPTLQRERFVTLNGLGANDRLVPGRIVKLVVNG